MKKVFILIIAAGMLFMHNTASAQSKKELTQENENLKKENALMQAKIDSASTAGKLLQEQLDDKTAEAERMTKRYLRLEADYIKLSDTIKKNSSDVDRAIAWNDKIVKEQKEILNLETEFVNTIVDGLTNEEIEKSFKTYKAFLNETKEIYSKTKPFDEKDTFRKALLDLLDVFISVAENEYTEMVAIYTKNEEDITEADFERWEFLSTEVENKENIANDIFLLKQDVFAAEYNFELNED